MCIRDRVRGGGGDYATACRARRRGANRRAGARASGSRRCHARVGPCGARDRWGGRRGARGSYGDRGGAGDGALTVVASTIRLVCIDVDGTLVGSGGAVNERVWPAAARAREAGVALAVCSGRPGFGVTRALAAQVDPSGWHCFQNGASVVHLGSGQSRSSIRPSSPSATRSRVIATASTDSMLSLPPSAAGLAAAMATGAAPATV